MSIGKLCAAALLIGGGVTAAIYSSDLDRYFNPGSGLAAKTDVIPDEDPVARPTANADAVTPSEDLSETSKTSETSETRTPSISWVVRPDASESIATAKPADVLAEVFAEKVKDDAREMTSREDVKPAGAVKKIAANEKQDLDVPSEDEQLDANAVAETPKSLKSANIPGQTFVKNVKDDRVAEATVEARKAKPLKLAGKWRVTRAVHKGSNVPFDRYGRLEIEFDQGNIIIAQGDKREVGKLNASDVGMIGETSFAEIVIAPIEGDKKEIRGFYYYDNGELTLIWGAPGAARPDPTNRDDFAKARILTLQAAQ